MAKSVQMIPDVVKREDVRPAMRMDYNSPLDIPDGVKKDGYSYAWIRKSVRGEDDFRPEQMVRKGWTVVPTSRAPGMSIDPLNRNSLSRDYICYKDLILMERETIFSQREEQQFNEMNRTMIRSLPGVQNDLTGFYNSIPNMNRY